MACPRCGGTDRRAITPGYWECLTERTDYGYAPAPALGYEAHMVPHITKEVCGHRYQEGAPAASGVPVCPCGNFAVAQCVRCNRAVCGIHVTYPHGRALCQIHAEEVRQQRDEQQVRARAEALNTAEASVVEFDRLTPGYPCPPVSPSLPRTVAEMAADSARSSDGVPIAQLRAWYQRHAANETVRALIRHRNGLFTPALYKTGWVFSVRAPWKGHEGSRSDLSATHDGARLWLLPADGDGYWTADVNVRKGAPIEPNFAYGTNPSTSRTFPWRAAFVGREQWLLRRGITEPYGRPEDKAPHALPSFLKVSPTQINVKPPPRN